MRIEYGLKVSWPPLAWLAQCIRGSQTILVLHGRDVVVNDEFFFEGSWAGDFSAGNFDKLEILAGSGGRCRASEVIFTSPSSTVDRLQSLCNGRTTWISNSLACLLASTNAEVDITYNGWYADFYSIIKGLHNYKRTIETTKGALQLTYYDNIIWNGVDAALTPKPTADAKHFLSFEKYRAFLTEGCLRLSRNMQDQFRPRRMEFLGTTSTGYDSPTVCAIARNAGLKNVLCFDQSHQGEPDSGHQIAEILGLRPNVIADVAWRALPYPEIPFLAANAMGEEVRFAAASNLLSGRVLLTGYHGDKIWGTNSNGPSAEIIRGDPSGLGLSEFRLWAGFAHCPMPFWGIAHGEAIHQISTSPELTRWNVPAEYNRPLCRRIVEEAGVPRHAFGVSKRNASVIMHNYSEFMTPKSIHDYLAWLKDHAFAWRRNGRLPPIRSVSLDRALYVANNKLESLTRNRAFLWRIAAVCETNTTPLRRYTFAWALSHACRRYGDVLGM